VCVAIILAFLACWGLAALPTVLVQTIKGAQAGVPLDLTFALLIAVPPAVVNASFVGLSGARLNGSKGRRALLDFATFGIIGGACAVLVFAFQQLRTGADFPFLQVYAADIATMFVVSGLFGALQCSISRGLEASARRMPLAGSDATGLRLRALPQA
jgi:hypothetical protein